MAPRSAKTKKAADVKVAENEAPKKGRGKAKKIEETEQEVPDIDIDEKSAPVTEKKPKRGKKAESNGELTNGEDVAPPAKKGRKKNIEEPISEEKESNGENSAEEESNPADDQNGDHNEANGNSEEVPIATGKGRKKQVKKDDKAEVKPKETTRGRKAKQESVDMEEKEVVNEEKPKGKGRGRKAQPKLETEQEQEDKIDMLEEEVKVDPPATKGRKKGQSKTVMEKTPESEKDEAHEEQEDEKPGESKKKETKGRKGKKVQTKDEIEEKEEEIKEEPASKKRKVTKKDEKAKGDSKEEDIEETADAPEVKLKGKRGKKAAEVAAETEEEPQDTGESTTKRRRKPADDKAAVDDSKKNVPLKNKSVTTYDNIDFSNSSTTSQGKAWNFKIASWNVDGIRAWIGKGGLDYVKYEKPDILCLQEIKCSKDKLPDEAANLPGYHAYWICSDKDGYAGVGIYTTQLAMNVHYGLQNEELDNEGRIITAEYEQFYLICTYVPNAGRNLVTLPKRLQWNEEFRKHVKELDKKKPVIICGDMNVAHNEIDLANPKTNKKNAGFTVEERTGMTDLLGDGFVDTYRHLYPDKTGAYSFWTYMKNSRAKNVGWRLDYFIVSERLMPSVCDNVIRDEVYGSDHCPISLFLHLTSADKPKE